MREIEILGELHKKSTKRTVKRLLKRWLSYWKVREGLNVQGSYYVKVERLPCKEGEPQEIVCSIFIRNGQETLTGTALGKTVSSAVVFALRKIQSVYITLPKRRKSFFEREELRSA